MSRTSPHASEKKLGSVFEELTEIMTRAVGVVGGNSDADALLRALMDAKVNALKARLVGKFRFDAFAGYIPFLAI